MESADAPSFRPVDTRHLTDQVYEVLRKAMLDGVLRPWQRLNTSMIASQLGVSQSPVRQAIALLAKDELIEIRPRSGTFVRVLSVGDLSDIMDIRRALELLACEYAVNKATAGDVSVLRRLANEIKDSVNPFAVTHEAAKKHDQLNSAFHESFVQLSKNRRLARLYKDLEVHQHMTRVHMQFSHWGKSLETETRQHLAIVDAVERRDLIGLRAIVGNHVRYSRALLIKGVKRWLT